MGFSFYVIVLIFFCLEAEFINVGCGLVYNCDRLKMIHVSEHSMGGKVNEFTENRLPIAGHGGDVICDI